MKKSILDLQLHCQSCKIDISPLSCNLLDNGDLVCPRCNHILYQRTTPDILICEATLQTAVIDWAMNTKKHVASITNTTTIFFWETDVLTITTADYLHEYEIKLNTYDYERDFTDKKRKHELLKIRSTRCPNYFWYVVNGFLPMIPEYAGLITVTENIHNSLELKVIKEAPLLHRSKAPRWNYKKIAKLLSYRLLKFHSQLHPIEK